MGKRLTAIHSTPCILPQGRTMRPLIQDMPYPILLGIPIHRLLPLIRRRMRLIKPQLLILLLLLA